jgi:hypothetical protein
MGTETAWTVAMFVRRPQSTNHGCLDVPALVRDNRRMTWLFDLMVGTLAVLCRLFQVTPDGLRRGRRGNLPPSQGGPW